MNDRIVPTIDFSAAKATLSDVMDIVFHQHRPTVVSRHRGKEQMVLVRPDDLVALLGDQRLNVQAIYDEGEVTLRVPGVGILGFGNTLDEATDDLIEKLDDYAARFFEDGRYLTTNRREHAGQLLRFALSDVDGKRSMLSVDEPAPARQSATV